MRVKTSSWCLALLLTGCGPNQTASTTLQPTEPPSAGASTSPVAFELRDFRIDKQSQSYGAAMYSGHGTLVTKDPRVASGNYLVWVTAKQAQENDQEAKLQVFLRDGIGTVETSDFQTSDEEKTEKVRYYDWKILGYIALSPGTLKSSDETPADPSSKKE